MALLTQDRYSMGKHTEKIGGTSTSQSKADLWCYLALIGLALGLASHLMGMERSADAFAGVVGADVVQLSPQERLLNVSSVFCVTVAGICSFLSLPRKVMPPGISVLFILLQIYMAGHSYLAFREGFEWYELGNQKGPAVWICMTVLWVAVRDANWKLIDRAVWLLGMICVVWASYKMARSGLVDRRTNMAELLTPAVLLIAVGSYVLMSSIGATAWRQWSAAAVILVGLLVALVCRSRSWLFLYVLMLGMRLVAPRLIERSRAFVGRLEVKYATTLGIVAMVGLFALGQWSFLSDGISALSDRLYDDTAHVLQRVTFFEDGYGSTLILGLGPKGKWIWNGRPYEYLEGGFWTMAFTGGIPLVVSYAIVVIVPGVRAALRRPDRWTLGCAASLVVFGVSQVGIGIFIAPTATVSHFLWLLYAGRCLGFLGSSREVCFERGAGRWRLAGPGSASPARPGCAGDLRGVG